MKTKINLSVLFTPGVLILVFGILIAGYLKPDKERDEIDNLYITLRQDLLQGKSQEAYQLFSPARRAEMNMERIDKYIGFIREPEYQWTPQRWIKIEGTRAIIFPRKTSKQWSGPALKLVWTNGNWYFSGDITVFQE